jgi:hypothetical protein
VVQLEPVMRIVSRVKEGHAKRPKAYSAVSVRCNNCGQWMQYLRIGYSLVLSHIDAAPVIRRGYSRCRNIRAPDIHLFERDRERERDRGN